MSSPIYLRCLISLWVMYVIGAARGAAGDLSTSAWWVWAALSTAVVAVLVMWIIRRCPKVDDRPVNEHGDVIR